MCSNKADGPRVPDWVGRKAGDVAHDRIASMLVLDIGQAQEWAKRVLCEVVDVTSGKADGWEMVMNAHILSVGREYSDISSAYEEDGEDGVQVRTGDLQAALTAWIAMMEQGD